MREHRSKKEVDHSKRRLIYLAAVGGTALAAYFLIPRLLTSTPIPPYPKLKPVDEDLLIEDWTIDGRNPAKIEGSKIYGRREWDVEIIKRVEDFPKYRIINFEGTNRLELNVSRGSQIDLRTKFEVKYPTFTYSTDSKPNSRSGAITYYSVDINQKGIWGTAAVDRKISVDEYLGHTVELKFSFEGWSISPPEKPVSIAHLYNIRFEKEPL